MGGLVQGRLGKYIHNGVANVMFALDYVYVM